jgi:hypothetical protein
MYQQYSWVLTNQLLRSHDQGGYRFEVWYDFVCVCVRARARREVYGMVRSALWMLGYIVPWALTR